MIKAEIIADSKNEHGNRITTMILTFPRMILAELNTHRMLSKNSASSRAIPTAKMLESIKDNPFIPIAWQMSHKGMQGVEYFTNPKDIEGLVSEWISGRNAMIQLSESFDDAGVTKQIVNRHLELYSWHTVIITGTEWENFFKLRCPKYRFFVDGVATDFRSRKDAVKACPDLLEDGIHYKGMTEMDWLQANMGQAEIHMMALAESAWDAMNESVPKQLKAGEWHIPFEDQLEISNIESHIGSIMDGSDASDEDFQSNVVLAKVQISSMMCARTSYTTVGSDGTDWTVEKYLDKYQELITSDPIHASPLEHCAMAMNEEELMHNFSRTEGNVVKDGEYCETVQEHGWCANYRGFIQHRKFIKNENAPQSLLEVIKSTEVDEA